MMMMAYDSEDGRADLSEVTIRAVRDALGQYVDAPSRAPDLRDALNVMAREAREKAIFPEHLLVVLKDIWYALPNVRTVNDPEEQVRMLQRVVTMCIKEYYVG